MKNAFIALVLTLRGVAALDTAFRGKKGYICAGNVFSSADKAFRIARQTSHGFLLVNTV
jgi:hypothetical protein